MFKKTTLILLVAHQYSQQTLHRQTTRRFLHYKGFLSCLLTRPPSPRFSLTMSYDIPLIILSLGLLIMRCDFQVPSLMMTFAKIANCILRRQRRRLLFCPNVVCIYFQRPWSHEHIYNYTLCTSWIRRFYNYAKPVSVSGAKNISITAVLFAGAVGVGVKAKRSHKTSS